MDNSTLNDDLIAEIEAAAKAATPGQWDWGGTPVSKPEEALEICRASIELTKNPGPYFCEVYTQDGKRTAIVGHGPTGQQNARHIAAANPANVLALTARMLELEKDAARHRMRVKELDLLFGRYLLGMKAAVIELEHGRGAEAAMQWIINGLIGPGEMPAEDETDAQAFFDREIAPINAAMSELFEARSAERVLPLPEPPA